jgi:hypothetical protein
MADTIQELLKMQKRSLGYGGDYAISAGTTPTTGLLFTHIYITSDATITDVKVGGSSVKAARHYTGTLPAGYLLCAGADATFNYILFATGSAEGFTFSV